MIEHKSNYLPYAQAPLVLVRVKESYRKWHEHLSDINRIDRITIGIKVDDVFLSLLEIIFRACFISDKLEKLSCISIAIAKSDLLKFLLQIAWEERILSQKLYGVLILDLDEIGRMLGGWKRTILNKTPAK